ncbi:MAG: response regulator [Polyangiaceae bacterium]
MSHGSAYRFLVADDSAVVRTLVRRRAEKAGVALVVAESFADGVNRIRDDGPYDAALFDLDLGDGTGPDLAARFRASWPDAPFAFFTGGATATVAEAARALGPSFGKPDGLDDAFAWLEAELTSRRRP